MIERNQQFGGLAWLQSVDYSYNDQGWLTSINQSSLGGTNISFPTCTTSVVNPGTTTTGQADDTKDLFYMQLQYNTLHAGLSGTLRSDGNISQQIWRVRGRERKIYKRSRRSRTSNPCHFTISSVPIYLIPVIQCRLPVAQ
jgi:hypothetical protein